MNPIYVDPREKDEALLEGIPNAEEKYLKAGDACFQGIGPGGEVWWIGVERKKIPDLVSSFLNKKLQRQINDMKSFYQVIYLIVEGAFKVEDGELLIYHAFNWQSISAYGHGIPFAVFAKVIDTFASVAGVSVIMSPGPKETAAFVAALQAHWNEKPITDRTADIAPHKFTSPTRHSKPVEMMLVASVRNIGFKKARSVAELYPTASKLVEATLSDLESISGIGQELARRIWLTLRNERTV